MDYAYTLQGWIKGVNSEMLAPANDIGRDGLNIADNANKNFARDAFGYSLRYYTGDYSPIDTAMWNNIATRFEGYRDSVNSDIPHFSYNLYNGNINTQVTSVTNPKLNVSMPVANAYKYDQLNRLIQSASFMELEAPANVWNNEDTYYGYPNPSYLNKFAYDANGNIQSQVRKDLIGLAFDSLTYRYNVQNGNLVQNRLYHVNDTIPAGFVNDDIDDEGTFNPSITTINQANNYSYDGIGNLVRDSIAGIVKVDWTVYNKIKSITHRTGFYQLSGIDTIRPPDLCFNYDAKGDRISKVIKPRTTGGLTPSTSWTTEYYVRDAQGNILSTYRQRDSSAISTLYFTQTEKHIYGSSRIGIDETHTQLLGLMASSDTTHHYTGYKVYEMNNHLGNVLTTISDKKIAVNPQSPYIVYSSPDVVRTGIDSLGGMKIQPQTQYGGNNFNIPSDSGSYYKFDFYVNLANTNPDSVVGDFPVISYDANNINGYGYNWLGHTGHYTFTYQAPDTLFGFKILYYGAGNIPHDYLLFDSLQIVKVGSTADTIIAFTSDIRSVSDVTSYGASLKDRSWQIGASPNSINGQRKDDEVYGAGNLTTAENWEYDPRVVFRWNLDPKYKAWQSPYVTFSGNPITHVDPNGDDDYYSKAGTYLGQVGTGTAVRIIDKPQYEEVVKNQGSTADFEAASHVLKIQDAGQAQYLKGIADATNNNCNEQGAYVVLDLSDEQNPTLRYEKNNSASDDISISHKVASGKISAEDVKYPVGSNGKADKSLVIVGEVHGHSETDSQGRPIKSGVSQQTNSSGGNDVNVAKNLKVPVYAVDQKNIHKVDQKGNVDNNKPTNTNVLKDALETKGGKPTTP